MKSLFLLLVIVSFCFSSELRRDSASSVVIDTSNKLMWVDDSSVVKIKKTHQDSEVYCETLSFAGYEDWRLPDIKEFALIVDKRNERSNINKAFRFNVKSGYWASKAHWRTFWFYADYMFFVSGTPYYDSRHKEKFVRCVRDIK